MIITLLRLTMSLALLAANIALRLMLITGTLIEWVLLAAFNAMGQLRRSRPSAEASSSRSFLPLQTPEPPQDQDEFTPRRMHRRRK